MCVSAILKKVTAIVGVVGTLTASNAAFAQNSASDITPDSLAPPLQRLNGSVVFTGQAGTQAPTGSEQIGITLSGVDLDDALPQLAAENDAFVARLTGGRIPVSELFEATAALEAAYAEAGLVLSRVILPQQSLREGGRLKVVVLNGFVEQIDTTNIPEKARARIEGLTASLKDKPGLTRAELERQLLLAGDAPGTALRSALTPGKAQGAAVIALETDFRPVTGFLGFSNATSSDLGRFNLNTGVEFNSPFKLGETLYFRFSGAPHQFFGSAPRSRILAGGFVVPLGFSGLNLNVEATSSDTTTDTPATPIRSSFDRQSIRLLYPFIRSRQINVTGQVSLDQQMDKQDFLAGGVVVPLFEDKITVLRFGGNITYIHEDNAVTDAGFVLARGLDALGARTAQEAAASGLPLSRDGSDAEFTKLTGSVSHRRALTDKLALSVTGRF
jgi:hemolysin activation/secretion protein